MWEAVLFCTHILVLSILVLGLYDYIRLKRQVSHIYCIVKQRLGGVMDCDELLNRLLEEDLVAAPAKAEVEIKNEAPKRERLVALAAGGQAKHYLGRALTPDMRRGLGRL
jgi:hypothetical protein